MQFRRSTLPAIGKVMIPLVSLVLIILFAWGTVAAQTDEQVRQQRIEIGLKPIYLTLKMFQLKAPAGAAEGPTDQVFRIKTSSVDSYDKWMRSLAKTYSGFEVSVLRTDPRKVFRTAKPTTFVLGRAQDGRELELMVNGAQSYGDGVTPGTSLVPELVTSFSKGAGGKPVTVSLQPLEAESGYTYFYAVNTLKFNNVDYTKFFRSGEDPKSFEGYYYYIVLGYSVELENNPQPARYFDERRSVAEIEEKATRKVQIEMPAAIRDAGINGFIRVRVEINPEGKVTNADIQSSSVPEINDRALAAALQWEFPQSLFAEDKAPLTGFITFRIVNRPPAGKPAQ